MAPTRASVTAALNDSVTIRRVKVVVAGTGGCDRYQVGACALVPALRRDCQGKRLQDLMHALQNTAHARVRDARQLDGFALRFIETLLAQIQAVEQPAAADHLQHYSDQQQDAGSDAHGLAIRKFTSVDLSCIQRRRRLH
jgi:hypothetical protein